MRWFHRDFNATSPSRELTAHRFWNFLPFRDDDRLSLEHMFASLHSSNPEDEPIAANFRAQITEWLQAPFQPHRIARLRPSAYKKWLVTQHIKNLILIGDQLFRRGDTIETINEATQYYVMAGAIAPRVERVPRRIKPVSMTYSELRKLGIDEFNNTVVEAENEFPIATGVEPSATGTQVASLLGVVDSLYFGIPPDDTLSTLWDTVDDRLYKIRHSLNIEGVFRALPLFEPKINPADLVKAAAQGMSLGSALAALGASFPLQRFSVVLQRALALAADVKVIAAAFQTAIEKKESEILSKMRASHETAILSMAQTVSNQQIEEAKVSLAAARSQRQAAVGRWQHYQAMLGQTANKVPEEPKFKSSVINGEYKVEYSTSSAARYSPSGRFELVDLSSLNMGVSLSGPGTDVSVSMSENDQSGTRLLSFERDELVNSFLATGSSVASSAMESLAALMNLIPSFGISLQPLGMGATVSFGGSNMASALSASARLQTLLSTVYNHNSSRSAKLASIVLRERDWGLQNDSAAAEIEHNDLLIVAAQIRLDLEQRKAENQLTQIGLLQKVEETLLTKFSNEDLYHWLENELFSQYTIAFDMAQDLAKRAEQCYRFERGVTDSNFIQPTGYWESSYQGLLAGERLHLALRQMERAYEDQNQREYELTKSISLLQLDPFALIKLKETGRCEFEIPEALFDMDYPGHYMRRIRSVSITIPCVVGPYTTVNATLRLLNSAIRWQSIPGASYPRTGDDDQRFYVNRTPTQAIATSTGQNDSGMFELNFRDERYLPFEGAGAISHWSLDFGSEIPQFDRILAQDVLVLMKLGAREGGDRLKKAANDALKKALKSETGLPGLQDAALAPKPLARWFSLRHEFPGEYHQLMGAPLETEPAALVRAANFSVLKQRFSVFFQGAELKPLKVHLIAIPKPGATLGGFSLKLKTAPADAAPIKIDLVSNALQFGNAFAGATADGAALAKIAADPLVPWSLEFSGTKAQLQALSESLQDLAMVVTHTATFPG